MLTTTSAPSWTPSDEHQGRIECMDNYHTPTRLDHLAAVADSTAVTVLQGQLIRDAVRELNWCRTQLRDAGKILPILEGSISSGSTAEAITALGETGAHVRIEITWPRKVNASDLPTPPSYLD
jgi:hypothetical protein